MRPESYNFSSEEMLALVAKLDQYDAATRSNFLGLVAASARGEHVALLSEGWPPRQRHYWLGMTGAQERLFIRCFEHIRYGDAPLAITNEGLSLLLLIAQFYPDEINEHIGPFCKVYAHLRAPPKPKTDKKPKKDMSDGVV